MFGYIYKITVNNSESIFDKCYYIGQHRCTNLSKSYELKEYFGSSTYLKQYKKKYKTFGLIKEIICECKDEEELNQKEKEIIGNLYLTDSFSTGGKCLNLKEGGICPKYGPETKKKMSNSMIGNKHMLGHKHSKETKEKMSDNARNNNFIDHMFINNKPWNTGQKMSEEFCNKISIRNIGNSYHLGKKHTEETKRKISKKMSQSLIGLKWWNNGIIQKKSRECPGENWLRGSLKKGVKNA